MFDKYGEVGCVAELNAKAEDLREAGDAEGVKAFALENGLDEMDVQDYLDGVTEPLATTAMAAIGRLKVEEEDYKKKGKTSAMEKMAVLTIKKVILGNMDKELAAGILKKGKRMGNIVAAMKEEAKKHQSAGVGVSCGTDLELLDIIRAYYLQFDNAMKKKIKELYD